MDIGAVAEVRKNPKSRIQNSEWMLIRAMVTKPAKTFKDLIVWKKAHEFVLAT
jgi:hypothetical protein